jgi:hypothetical protein
MYKYLSSSTCECPFPPPSRALSIIRPPGRARLKHILVLFLTVKSTVETDGYVQRYKIHKFSKLSACLLLSSRFVMRDTCLQSTVSDLSLVTFDFKELSLSKCCHD